MEVKGVCMNSNPSKLLPVVLVLVAATLVACPTTGITPAPVGETTPNPSDGQVTKGDVNAVFADIPNWRTFSPLKQDANPATGGTVFTNETVAVPRVTAAGRLTAQATDNLTYRCGQTLYSITKTPDAVVTMEPDATTLWPGALLQGRSVLKGLGALEELPVRQRTPLTLTFKNLNFAGNTVVVADPKATSVNAAIGTILQNAQKANVTPASSTSFNVTEAFSAKQFALQVGASANFLIGSASGKLTVNTSANQHTVAAYYVQKAFTIGIDQPQSPAEVFSRSFTPELLAEETSQGRISKDNPTAYVSSVTYGRIMMLTLTSTASSSEIQAALNASGRILGIGGSGSLTTAQKEILKTGTLKIATVGGDESNARALISSGGDLRSFFSTTSPVTAFAPISYEVRSLKDNTIATVSETIPYIVKQCALTKASIPVDLPESLKISVRIGADELDEGSIIWGKFTYAGGQSSEFEIANGLASGRVATSAFTMPAGVKLGDLQSFVFRFKSKGKCFVCGWDQPDIAEIIVQVENSYISRSMLLTVPSFRIRDREEYQDSYILSNTK
jgi:Thiol-activated cytolysin